MAINDDVDNKNPSNMIKQTIDVALEELSSFRNDVLNACSYQPLALVYSAHDGEYEDSIISCTILNDMKKYFSEKDTDIIYEKLSDVSDIIVNGLENNYS